MSTKQVLSPLPGIFYRKPSPDQPAYKQEGDQCAAGDVIGLVEVMKSFHEVKSSATGVITRVLVDNEDAVIAGQALMEIEE